MVAEKLVRPSYLDEWENHDASIKGGFMGLGGATLIMGLYALGLNLNPESFNPVQFLAIPLLLASSGWAGASIPFLHASAMMKSYEKDEKAKSLETPSQEHTGLTIKNAPHLLLMWAPNLLKPSKFFNNVRQPIYEIIHTKHKQYPVEGVPETYVVEHELFGKLVTVDVIKRDRYPHPWLLRLRQLFDRSFYYGHAQYFPEAFKLIDRTYVESEDFDMAKHVREILA